ncbi:MAG: 2-iminobutanoate/2-iminopropanoate deaminase [Chlamydiae bacterium]|nr:2-iminobutanoate/2-iminopropanoate deaminase [Chlamydiota bacterium]
MPQIQSLKTDNAPKAIGPYSQAIQDGTYLFVSGQLPIDPNTGKIESDDIKGQGEQVLINIEAILREVGLDFTDVVRVEVFMKNLSDFGILNDLYSKRFAHDTPPARQTVEVSRLPLDALVEISCIARLRR